MRFSWKDRRADPSRNVVALLRRPDHPARADIAIARGAGSETLQLHIDLFRVAIAIGGLALTHNLYISSAPANRWGTGLLCVALAGLFAYDVNLFTLAILDPEMAVGFFDARGIANAIVAPLFILASVRNRGLSLQLSRQAAFQTFALGAIGVYLVGMSVAAYLLGLAPGDWGRLCRSPSSSRPSSSASWSSYRAACGPGCG